MTKFVNCTVKYLFILKLIRIWKAQKTMFLSKNSFFLLFFMCNSVLYKFLRYLVFFRIFCQIHFRDCIIRYKLYILYIFETFRFLYFISLFFFIFCILFIYIYHQLLNSISRFLRDIVCFNLYYLLLLYTLYISEISRLILYFLFRRSK